jgi:hypothetical protein
MPQNTQERPSDSPMTSSHSIIIYTYLPQAPSLQDVQDPIFVALVVRGAGVVFATCGRRGK